MIAPPRLLVPLVAALFLLTCCATRAAWCDDGVVSPLSLEAATRVTERRVEGRVYGRAVAGLWSRLGTFADDGFMYEFEQQMVSSPDGERATQIRRYAFLPDGSPAWAWLREQSDGRCRSQLIEFEAGRLRVTRSLAGVVSRESLMRPAGNCSWLEALLAMKRTADHSSYGGARYRDLEGSVPQDTFLLMVGRESVPTPGGSIDALAFGPVLGWTKLLVDRDGLAVGFMHEAFESFLVDEVEFDDLTVVAGTIPIAAIDLRTLDLAEVHMELHFSGGIAPRIDATPYQSVLEDGDLVRVTLHARPRGGDAGGTGRTSLENGEHDRYLVSSSTYDTGDPRIRAAVLAGHAEGAHGLDLVDHLAHWVHDHIEGDVDADREVGLRDAAEILDSGRGSCEAYSTVLVTLLRSARIPARSVDGYLLTSDDRGVALRSHSWAEAWLGRWVSVDATVPRLGLDARYLALRFNRTSRGGLGLMWVRPPPRVRVVGFLSVD